MVMAVASGSCGLAVVASGSYGMTADAWRWLCRCHVACQQRVVVVALWLFGMTADVWWWSCHRHVACRRHVAVIWHDSGHVAVVVLPSCGMLAAHCGGRVGDRYGREHAYVR